MKYAPGRNPRSLANLRPFRPGFDPRRNVTGRNGKAELARERAERTAQFVELVRSPELSEETRGDLVEMLARQFIRDGLEGDPVTVRRLVEYVMRYEF